MAKRMVTSTVTRDELAALIVRSERLTQALREIEAAAGEYLAEHGIHGFSSTASQAEDVLVGIKDMAESALQEPR